MLINHDMHVHTAFSACCHDAAAIPESMLRRFDEVVALGIADGLAHPFLPWSCRATTSLPGCKARPGGMGNRSEAVKKCLCTRFTGRFA